MFGPVVGNFFSSRREFLYEQCSLHITEKIPSSVKFGSRPRIFLIRANSSGVRPCSSTTLGVIAGSAVGIRSIKISETMRPLKSCVSLWPWLQRLCEAFFQARRLTQTLLQQPVAIVPPGLRQESSVQAVMNFLRIRSDESRLNIKAVNS